MKGIESEFEEHYITVDQIIEQSVKSNELIVQLKTILPVYLSELSDNQMWGIHAEDARVSPKQWAKNKRNHLTSIIKVDILLQK